MKLVRGLAPAALLLVTTPALAHVDPSEHGSFAAGFTHPLFGLDHVLAMIAVGLWAALIGGRAILGLPTAFVSGMVIGFIAAVSGLHLAYVEPVILVSVVALGALVAIAARVPVALGFAICLAFGFFHGHAHGGELGSAGELAYAAGFVIATALLHLCGVLFGYGAKVGLGPTTRRGEILTRALGALTAACGLALMAG